jgi:hypothetical protein
MPWMTDLYYDPALANTPRGAFPTRPLRQITLPGTHDSGCYRSQTLANVWSQTQTEDIGQQLAGGVRYFDLRPCARGIEFWTYHGPLYWGGELTGADGILEQISDYFDSLAPSDRELVILNISHFYNFTNLLHANLVTAIQAALGPHLVLWNQAQINVFNCAYSQLLSGPAAQPERSRVMVLYDGALDTPVEPYVAGLPFTGGGGVNGFFVLAPKYAPPNPLNLFDQYANSGRLSVMSSDQLNKLRQRQNYPYTGQPFNPGNWFANAMHGTAGTLQLLSWTLTPQFSASMTWNPVVAAAETTNPALLDLFCDPNGGWAGPYYNPDADPQVNIIYVDNYWSQSHRNPGSSWDRMAIPVAIAARMNVGPVGPRATW